MMTDATASLASQIEAALKRYATTNIRRIRPKQQREIAETLAREVLAQTHATAVSGSGAEESGKRLQTLGLSIESALNLARAIREHFSMDGCDAAALDAMETYTYYLLRGFFHAWMDKLRKEAEITLKAWNQIPDEKK